MRFSIVLSAIMVLLLTACTASVVHAPDTTTGLAQPETTTPTPTAHESRTDQQTIDSEELTLQVWAELDHTCAQLITLTHQLGTCIVQSGLSDARWESVARFWRSAVSSWLYGIEQLRQASTQRDYWRALLQLENNLLDLERYMNRLEETAHDLSIHQPDFQRVMTELHQVVVSARQGVGRAHERYSHMTNN
ncbi:hypothetical protein KKF05_02730 [Patescibacteria group bacterium]|nr:hypothetical protein [Patescibacteria group bacterium]MBU1029353.1 hypothetical protein [Patescibacteria group bacterium]MBU1916353.1 hypothetical protein [Patescibacteria group bacterium]